MQEVGKSCETAVKQLGWTNGPFTGILNQNAVALEGLRYQNSVGIPAKSALNPMLSPPYSQDQFMVVAVDRALLPTEQHLKSGSKKW